MSLKDDDIAVIGMSGRFPGANSVAELWANLCAGQDGIRTLSDAALRAAGVAERDIVASSYVKASATLDEIEMFDAGFFKVSPLEAEILDPQVRLLLQCAWETLEDAGHATRKAQKIGVFAGAGGVTTSYFSHFVNVNPRFERITASPAQLGNDKDFLATYLSYKLNLTGPSMTVQTACSTSLVALHLARSSVLNGECDMALAGGVTIRVPHGQGYHHREGYIFSKSGRVKAFDERADGVVFGSGLGLVLIRKLSDAIRDGDSIHAVIKGSAVVNDGRGKMSYAASSARGQIACVRAALKSAAVQADAIGFVEAHGTGTAMGDPEEVKALSHVFKEHTDKKTYCALGAVKTNVGHSEAAAGIIGFIKAALAVKHGVIPPTAHYATPNPRIKFDNTPFFINSELRQWDEGERPRVAAVNSLGVGGTNAFVILQQHVAAETSQPEHNGPFIVPLSAKTEWSLRAYALRIAEFLAANEVDLANLAYTLQRGRDAMECRVAFVSCNVAELQAQLACYLQGTEVAAHGGEAGDLAASWIAGTDVDWESLYPQDKPRRISLPTYVFAKDRYWIDSGNVVPERAVIHPLLHVNTSDLSEQKYTSTFTPDEFFLKDHQVRMQRQADAELPLQAVLPAVVSLEMARAAIEQSMPDRGGASFVELSNVAWLQPIMVSEAQRVSIAVLPRELPGQPDHRIDFEIYTADSIHCQGQCSLAISDGAPARIDVAALKASMQRGRWAPDELYASFKKMGLNYGPACRPISGVESGERQLIAQLTLPEVLAPSEQDYVLHPSLMDGALQAAATLLFDANRVPGHPIVPFALETLRVFAPCRREMVVWVRFADGSHADDKSVRLDIDLLDASGNVCVQMLGYTPRSLGKESSGSLLATQEWVSSDSGAVPTAQQRQASRSAADQGLQDRRADQSICDGAAPGERHVIVCDLPQIDAHSLSGDCSALRLDRDKSIAERYDELALDCFDRIQALIGSRPQGNTLVQVVLPNTPEHAVYAGSSGLLKTARQENPRVAGQLILVDAGISTDDLARLLHAEATRAYDALIRYDDGVRHVARWRFLDEDNVGVFGHDGPFKNHGVYLITGGLGGLGALFAKEILARTSNATIVLTGRASPAAIRESASRQAILDSLRADGATVDYWQLDLGDRDRVENVIASIGKEYKQLNGIIHCAGMTADSFILKKTRAAFREVLAAKTVGTHHLDAATRNIDLDFMVLFSSLTSALGNVGQADYAAANGFMDTFAAYRNRLVQAGERQGRTLAIRWPLWKEGGMHLNAADAQALFETTGTRPMQTATGMRMFYLSLALGLDQTLVMEGEPQRMQRSLGSRGMTPIVDTSIEASTSVTVARADVGNLTELTEHYLCKQLAAPLKLAPDRIDPRAPLENYGIDSILSLDLTRLLEKTFGALPKTLFFEYLTIRDLAAYFVDAHAPVLAGLFERVGGTTVARADDQTIAPARNGQLQVPAERLDAADPQTGPTIRSALSIRSASKMRSVPSMRATSGNNTERSDSSQDPGATQRQASMTHEPIAIVGLSGRYPQARNLEAFWHNLRDGRDCIVEVPKERWDWRDYYSEDRSQKGHHFSKWGGFIDGVDEFDARFFNISPLEAQNIDPQERLFLQHAWMAIEDAGYTRTRLQIPKQNDLAAQVGVYAGVMYSEYQLFGAEASLQGDRKGFASNPASIANRVSYFLNLHGPSMVVDTMCSSSLTAIHLACQDLRLGYTSLGIAGGVNVTIHPNKYLMLSAGQFISGDGHCQSFGEGGDGYIPGEGVGVVVLKRLCDAERDGDHIYGVIRGSALSHGGKTNGYTVPNPQAQASAIRQALAQAGVDPRHISYIEAHGTGTKLGDPIEIAALTRVFQEGTRDTAFCRIGSVKSNIGHAEAAAGIAGLTKVLLQLKHRRIVPSLHSSRLNPHIEFDATPFVVNQSLTSWEQPLVDGKSLPRIAGISSFGAGGSNAHLIVEEYSPPVVTNAQPDAEIIVPLSARTSEQLHHKVRDLLDFIRGATSPLDLLSVAYTLQVGREAMDERLAVLVTSVTALADKLQGYLDGNDALEGVYRGEIKASRDTLGLLTQDPDLHAAIEKWIAQRRQPKLAELWVKGLELDWRKFHSIRPRPVSLPTYPFSQQRFWIDATAAARRVSATSTTNALHPLLHRNTSDFSQQSYATTFTGDEFFLAGSAGEKCLAEAACLEMARAAFDAALPAREEFSILELRDVAWAQPGVAIDRRQVTIALFDQNDEQVKFEIYSTLGGEREAPGSDEVVLCQGRVLRSQQPAPARLDLTAPGAQPLIELRLPASLQEGQQDYVIHPALLQPALDAAARTVGMSQPLTMTSLRVVFPLTKAKFARLQRTRADDTIDIDLCDEQGNVCAQMRGLRYAPTVSAVADARLEAAISSRDAETPMSGTSPHETLAATRSLGRVAQAGLRGRPVALSEHGGDSASQIRHDVLDKPNASIVLTAPSAAMAISVERDVTPKPTVSLPAAMAVVGTQASSRTVAVGLFDLEDGIFCIRVDASSTRNALSPDVIADLLSAIRTVQDAGSAKVLMIEGGDDYFLTGGLEHHQQAVASQLYRAIVELPVPVIAVARGDALGAGFLVASVCDFIVCSESARYAFTLPEQGMLPPLADDFLIERYGEVLATDLLYLATNSTGAQLKEKGWTCPILPHENVSAYARNLAASLARKSQLSLRVAKQHLARPFADMARALQAQLVADNMTPATEVAASNAISAPSTRIQLDTHEHVLVLTIRAQAADFSAGQLLADVESIFGQIDEASPYRCVLLSSELPGFLPEVAAATRAELVRGFKDALSALKRPIVAALRSNASGTAWTVAQLCDVCIYSDSGHYSCSDLVRESALDADNIAAIYSLRLGAELARKILLSGAEWSGGELRSHGALHVVASERVVPRAKEIATILAKLPLSVLTAWKRRTARAIQDFANDDGAVAPVLDATDSMAAADTLVAVPLESKVISATAHPQGILEVRMADRDAKNMFSDAFSRGMHEVFAHVRDNRAYKVVVLTGYDNYFSAGGTLETLLAIQQGRLKFIDDNVFELPLNCEVPVIAAMQGHGIGAGWAMGMSADLVLFSEESRYCSPYLGYGFTPGAGATLMFPLKIGQDLARETLLTANEYSGAELKDRGLCHPVLPRKQVLPAAMALARDIARSSRERLVSLKQFWARQVRAALPDTLQREVTMHEQTFVGRADALSRIQRSFGADADRAATPAPAGAAVAKVDPGAIAIELKRMLAHELHMPEHEIAADEQFVELGLDSITGVTWIRKINEKYRTAIEAIQIYSHPTLTQFSRFVIGEAGRAHAPAPQPAGPQPAEPARSGDVPSSIATLQAAEPVVRQDAPSLRSVASSLTSWRAGRKSKGAASTAGAASSRIAVIGMAGQFARARNLEQFWRNIAEGRDCIAEVPRHRWDIERYYEAGEAAPGKTYSKWMGALDDYDRFDAAFFNVSPREARGMDPQQRLFLQTCWHSIEHAGYNPKTLAGSKCGVFAGCAAGDYHQISKREQLSGQGFTGAAPSILAARISYFLDLRGPSLSIDTACSSSLVAIATACDSLTSGASDIALAGGVNVMAGPAMQIMTSQVGMLSPQGRCFSFDARADGIVNGEGVGVVMLKRLADAERDGDWIYGVIEGWGVNQDGKTNGITAPNPDSQARLQQEVYDRYRIDPAHIQLIEAHGTGTALGDPIEVAGLHASFKKYTSKQAYCALGSVKSNIGHCLTAAGASGFLKILLAMQHRQLPPTIHFEQLNPHVSLRESPFYINDRLREWPRTGTEPRRAAINSFGFGGTNAHVVIAEYRDQERAAAPREPTIVPLSARTTEQLTQKARDLLSFLHEQTNASPDLRSIACTLQTGREEMDERVAFVAHSIAELQDKLLAYIETQAAKGTEHIYRGQASGNTDTVLALGADPDFQRMIAKWIGRKELARVADLWTKGLALPWGEFYAATEMPRRIGLPVYPFARERHWIDATEDESSGALPTPVAAASPSLESVPEEETFEQVAPAVTRAVQSVALPSIPLQRVQNELRASLAEALYMKPSDVDVSKSFTDLGLDSIIGVEWVKNINKNYDTKLSATLVYDYPNVKALASLLHGELEGRVTAKVETTVAQPEPRVPESRRPQARQQAKAAMSLDELQRQLQASLAEALFMKPGDIEPGKPFTELGLDSIIGVEWVKSINKRYGTRISATRVYDYPSVKALASYLIGEMPQPELAPGPAPAIRFDPKGGKDFEALYFHSADCEGDFAANGEFSLRYSISPETNICLQEHVVFDEHLLPTDAYIELVYAAYRTYFAGAEVCLKDISIVNPMLGTPGRQTHVRLVFRRVGEDLQFFVKSSVAADFRNDKLHMQGFIARTDRMPSARFNDGFAIEQALRGAQIPTNRGVYYSPLQALRFGAAAAIGEIRVADHDFKFLVNPLALYGGLCTVINYGVYRAGRQYGVSDDHFLPHRIGNIKVLDSLDDAELRCYAEVRKLAKDAVELYFEIVDRRHQPVLVVDSISLRRVARTTIQHQAEVGKKPPAVAANSSSAAVRPPVAGKAAPEKVAIIGMSCRYPQSENAEALWNHLKAGRDCITEVPADRWSAHPDWYHPDPRHPHTSYSKWGGFLDHIDGFDALFFGISPAEAEIIDPQQRIFMEECWKAIESAGYAPSALSNESCGIYVGCAAGDYARVLASDGQDTVGGAFMGTSNAILAARMSYYLNLKGPALALDTACSSSLVAVHLACESIRNGECRMALAGGINILTTPLGHILTSQVGMPSRDGKCATFDASASGIVFSEGCGVLLLKALSQAQLDNDNILGVIEGSGINQDGKTNGITAPSSVAQEQLLRQVYDKFAIDPQRISYVEAHGTATPLGDPIEVNALTAVFRKFTDQNRYCALGSVKSNIGHTGFAAGVAGIVKVLLCMQHEKLVPSVHYREPNPHIDFETSPFHVNTQYRDWVSDHPRLASVSSFGFSGTNAHVVIGQSESAAEAVPSSDDVLVLLSAKAEEQLQRKARDLLTFLREQEQPVDLVRLAYTLQVGRDAMDHRVALICGSVEQLTARLEAWLDGNNRIEDVYRGRSSHDDALSAFADDAQMQTLIDGWIQQKNLAKLAQLWVRGSELNWTLLYDNTRPRRMRLPTYPFARERCWVQRATAHRSVASRQAVQTLHPLLHRNTSDLSQQSYTSTFTGAEFFLADHRIKGERVLPAVAYLEIAHAALMNAMPADQISTSLQLSNVIWAQPIVVVEPKDIAIAVYSEHGAQLGFEIYSNNGEGSEAVVHCQGNCMVGERLVLRKLDLSGLRAKMSRGAVEGATLYPSFAKVGLEYGPAFQGVVAIQRGEHELLVELELPAAAREQGGDYVLHPSMMDSALQGAAALIEDVINASGATWLPFALESLRILASCNERMVAWIRYSDGAPSVSSQLAKVDIDLCDRSGNVCVELRGFASRPMERVAAFDDAHYRSVIERLLSNQISPDEAVTLG